ncbi:MAG: PQQ-binding-like beta-propeller repeat protein [Polyangiales bacterium]
MLAFLQHLKGSPVDKLVPGDDVAAWGKMFNSMLTEVAPALYLQRRPGDDGAEARFFAGMLFALETGTRNEHDGIDQALAIAAGTLDLDTALRARELARLTTDVETAQHQLANAPAVTLDPVLLAQIAAANRLVVGDVTIPVPIGARAEPECTSYTADADGTIQITFITRESVAALHALYRCWARSEGWLTEVEDTDEVAGGLRVAKGSRRFGIILTPRGRDETSLMLHLNRTPEATYQRGTTEAAPALPGVTRPYPSCWLDDGTPLSPSAVVCDRGLLFLGDRNRVRMVDPTKGTIRVLAGGEIHGESSYGADGLVFDADGLWLADRGRNAIHRFDFASETVSTLTRELPRPIRIALAESTLYVTCERGELYSVDATTGTANQLLAENVLAQHRYDWAVEGIAIIGETLYAVEGSGSVHAYDRRSGAVRKVTEVPSKPRGMTTDGHALYVGCWGGIVRIRLGDPVVVEQIAGKDGFVFGDEDGPADVAGIDVASCPAWDGAGGLYFFDDSRRLRWLHVERRFVITVM